MRFIIVLLLFTTLSATSQNSEVLTWDVEYSIENINADSSIIKTLLSMISNQKTKINYYLHENNLVNIATYDSLNEIRTVMLKDESHTYVFVTLDGITTYKKKPISELNTKNNNGPLTSEEIPIVKFIENKMVGPFNCIVNEIIFPNMKFKLITTTTDDIQISNAFNNQLPIPELEKFGLALALEADFGFAKIHLQHGNFKTVPLVKSIFYISTDGLKETNMEESKLLKLISRSDDSNEIEKRNR